MTAHQQHTQTQGCGRSPLVSALLALTTLSSCGQKLADVCYMKAGSIMNGLAGEVPKGLSIICDKESEYLNIAAQTNSKIKDSGFIFNEKYKIEDIRGLDNLSAALNRSGFFFDQDNTDQLWDENHIVYYASNTKLLAVKKDMQALTINFNLAYK